MNSFVQYLVNQTSVFDEMVLRDMGKPYMHILPRDVRLLPNKLRKLWAKEPRLSKRKKANFRIQQRRHDGIRGTLETRLEAWITRLPKRQAKRERKMRTYSDSMLSWIGNVSTGTFPSVEEIELKKRTCKATA